MVTWFYIYDVEKKHLFFKNIFSSKEKDYYKLIRYHISNFTSAIKKWDNLHKISLCWINDIK